MPAHPNLFHDALERVAVAGWQVVQHDEGLTVRLLGARDRGVFESVERALRNLVEAIGAQAPAIMVTAADQLERGPTGKAPLIMRAIRNAP